MELKESGEQIDHPSHYRVDPFLVSEVLDVIEGFELGFALGNAIKYILRQGKKTYSEEDIRKAIWYLERFLGEHQLKKP